MEFGNALAGRGPTERGAGDLPGVLEYLEPVMKNLSAPDTRLERFISALAATAAEVAPVAAEQAEMFVNLDTTFTRARERRAVPLGDDRRDAADLHRRRGDPAHDQALPGQQRRPVQRAAPGHSGAHGVGAHDRRRARGRRGSAE